MDISLKMNKATKIVKIKLSIEYVVVAHTPNIIMSFTQTLCQISSECKLSSLRFPSKPRAKKPNQIILQTLNKRQLLYHGKNIQQWSNSLNCFMYLFAFFQICPSFRSYVDKTVTPLNWFFISIPLIFTLVNMLTVSLTLENYNNTIVLIFIIRTKTRYMSGLK